MSKETASYLEDVDREGKGALEKVRISLEVSNLLAKNWDNLFEALQKNIKPDNGPTQTLVATLVELRAIMARQADETSMAVNHVRTVYNEMVAIAKENINE